MARIYQLTNLWEDSGKVLGARLINDLRVALVQADITAIERKVFDLSGGSPETPIETDALTVASVIFDTLQTDVGWTDLVDATGYNFKDTVPATHFPTGGNEYKIQYKFTPATGQVFHEAYQGPATRVHGG